jgi:hypothetical protein
VRVSVDLTFCHFSRQNSETQLETFDQVASQRRLERWAIDHEAYVALYADTMLTIDEYNEMFKQVHLYIFKHILVSSKRSVNAY